MTRSYRASFLLPMCALAVALGSAAFSAPVFAQETPVSFVSSPEPTNEFSTSAPPEASGIERLPVNHLSRLVRPFSDLAVGVKVGVAGIGLDLATPLAQRFNIRATGSFFSYSTTFTSSGTNISGDLKLRSVGASLDWYPFNGRFRISPGITMYNGNALNANAMVPGGQSFDLGDATYTSASYDPIHGSASFLFGNRTAPSLTIGFGNMIARHGDGHFSIPTEIGFQYIGAPKITLALAGTACSNGICQSTANNPDFQSNLQQENKDLNNDISPLRFYPIASIGVAYRF